MADLIDILTDFARGGFEEFNGALGRFALGIIKRGACLGGEDVVFLDKEGKLLGFYGGRRAKKALEIRRVCPQGKKEAASSFRVNTYAVYMS